MFACVCTCVLTWGACVVLFGWAFVCHAPRLTSDSVRAIFCGLDSGTASRGGSLRWLHALSFLERLPPFTVDCFRMHATYLCEWLLSMVVAGLTLWSLGL